MPSSPALRFAAAAGVVLLVDQTSKAAVRAFMPVGESLSLVDGLLSLTHVRNTGAAFGIFPGALAWFILAAVVVLAGIVIVLWRHAPSDGWLLLALGLVAGGAMGNLVDRAIFGAVTDFFDVHIWPVFNVADIALDTGVAIVIIRLLLSGGRSGEAGEDG